MRTDQHQLASMPARSSTRRPAATKGPWTPPWALSNGNRPQSPGRAGRTKQGRNHETARQTPQSDRTFARMGVDLSQHVRQQRVPQGPTIRRLNTRAPDELQASRPGGNRATPPQRERPGGGRSPFQHRCAVPSLGEETDPPARKAGRGRQRQVGASGLMAPREPTRTAAIAGDVAFATPGGRPIAVTDQARRSQR